MPCDPDSAHLAKHHRAIRQAKKPAGDIEFCTAERSKVEPSERPYVCLPVGVRAASFTREPLEEAARAT